jgi:hypothetical protein
MSHRELGERPLENDGTWTLPIGDGEISQISVDVAVSFVVDADTVVRFETSFTWFDGTRNLSVDPTEVTQVAPLLGLLHKDVSAVTVRGSVVSVELVDGQTLVGEPHEKYEAWTATTVWGIPEERAFFVATPGEREDEA